MVEIFKMHGLDIIEIPKEDQSDELSIGQKCLAVKCVKLIHLHVSQLDIDLLKQNIVNGIILNWD